MSLRLFFYVGLLSLIISCSKNDITPPPFNPDENLVGTVAISRAVMKQLEGIYILSNGSADLGNRFVCKTSKNKISFFSDESGLFFILNYAFNPQDSSLRFSGFWRFSQKPSQGLIQFSILKNEGAADLVHFRAFTNLLLRGMFSGMQNKTQEMELSYLRPFSNYVKSHEFTIFGHHGVLTTANPPFSQNSLNAVYHANDYGVDGLEFDLRLTSDNVPICIHNSSIDILLTQKGPLSGDFNQYSFAFLQNYIRLIDGQKIPSVAQALTAFIDSTEMKYMWLDVKGDPDVFKYLEPVVRNAYQYAATKGRTVVIIADLPSQAVIDEFKAWPAYADLPSMCELSLQDAIDNNCKYFGPRYSLGLLQDDVAKAHSLGIKVYSWTLNEKNLIYDYLLNGKFDGFITDYPAYAVYDYYTLF